MPSGDRTRPTTDRVREALFSALAVWAEAADQPADSALAGLAFCDLYAGSGAVGLEAASRGAGPVLLVEADRRTAALARGNAADLGVGVEVSAQRVESMLARSSTRRYDIIFADPPYDLAEETLNGQLATICDHEFLAEGGLMVVERSRRTAPPRWPPLISQDWSRTYGETILYFGGV